MDINNLLDRYEKIKKQVLFKYTIQNYFQLNPQTRKFLKNRALPLFELAKKCLFAKYSINYDSTNNAGEAKSIIERFDYELALIIGEAFCEYYLLISDYVNWAKSQKILISGQGSLPCSFIAYLIGISDINPLDYNLPFERLSPLDHFKSIGFMMNSTYEGREKIIEYLNKKYGAEKIFNIFVKKENLRKSKIKKDSILIIDKNFGDFIPNEDRFRGNIVILLECERHNLGLQKISIVSSKVLNLISKIESKIRLIDENFCIDKIPFKDIATFTLLENSDTKGIFQFDSDEMGYLARKLKISSINEMAALIAIYRPGPMIYLERYIDGKFDISKRKIIHPLLNEILAETYGVLIYQEQFMMAVNILAGYSLREADILRREIGKNQFKVVSERKTDFIERAYKFNKIGLNEAAEIFDKLAYYCKFSFNKSHAVAYAIHSYKIAYLKANYRKIFEEVSTDSTK